MPSGKFSIVLAGAAAILAAVLGIHLAEGRPVPAKPATSVPSSPMPATAAAEGLPAAQQEGKTGDIAETTTNFIGTLTPGGTAEAAGKERNYVVTYQVAFLRNSPTEKIPEESLTYRQLQERDDSKFPPYFYYGEIVRGTFDPAHPDSIAVVGNFHGKVGRGFIDAQKLWLEPHVASVETARYMALKDSAKVHVVPDAASPSALALMQGEVVEAVGQVSVQGAQWIKARFNPGDVPRFGFLQAADVRPLTAATVNESAVSFGEIPGGIRGSKLSLSDGDRQKLSQIGFYVQRFSPHREPEVDDMVDAYGWGDRQACCGNQPFITSDLYLHVHHLIFDRMLQDVETKKFAPAIKELSARLAKTTAAERNALPVSAPVDVRNALDYDLVYFSVAAKLFDPAFPIPQAARADADEFVGKIQASAGELPSALSSRFGEEDFTQYKPRGHYEKNQTLQRYFRGMMWFGRRNFLLSDKNMTLSAILIPGLVAKAGGTATLESLDRSLGYLVGLQDKYTLAGYGSVNKQVFGTETPAAADLAGQLDERLQAFMHAAETSLPPPQIVSAATGLGKTPEERLKMARGFKLLGQRYTLDAYFFSQLTSPSVGTDQNSRNLPSALDVMMLLGSSAAAEQQRQAQQRNQWANYDSQTLKMQEVAHEHLSTEGNFYESWLSILNSLFLPGASKQLFTLGKPWQYKNLNAGAASWTELKHDTILYSEQAAAEQGEGEEFEIPPYSPPPPKGYVEPNPVFFQRQAQAIGQMLDRLKPAGMITDEYADKFATLRKLAQEAGSIAQKEVSGGAISSKEYAWIEHINRHFDSSLVLPRGADQIADRSQLQMALIADVATDAVRGRVLEVATGKPQRIIVLVKDAYGGTRLTIGYVYSWYEFPSSNRWADGEWKQIIYSEDAAAMKKNGVTSPAWYSLFSKD